MDGHCGRDAERWGIPRVLKFFHLRPMRDLDGKFCLTATPRSGYGQPFWFSDYRFPTIQEAMHSPDLYGPRGPSC